MGNSFGFLRTEGGFQFTVLDACEAEGTDLNKTCSLLFSSNGELLSIGNVTRGTMKPEPGVAGIGIWLAFIAFFAVILTALVFIIIESVTRAPNLQVGYFAVFKDSKINSPDNEHREKGFGDKIRAAGRTFVLSIADTQTIFVGAFLLSFAGKTKCSLTSYHFTVAVDQMMIALSAITFSVALVRTYWRNPLAAAFRLLLSLGTFIGVGMTIFRKANYAPDYPPPNSRNDSSILLPVACLLESNLRLRVQEEAKEAQSDLGFGNASDWPVERVFFILLAIAFIISHMSIPIRYAESKNYAPQKWSDSRKFFTATYWPLMLIPPTVTSIWCWALVFRSRKWVDNSGWIGKPNTEMSIWDSGQLIALGVGITVVMNVLSELWKRDEKDAKIKKGDSQRLLENESESIETERGPNTYPMTAIDAATAYRGYQPIWAPQQTHN